MNMKQNQLDIRGFNLVEIILVISILSILVGIGMIGMLDYVNYQRLQADVVEVSSQIKETRQRSLSADNDTNYGVHFETDSITVFSGDTYNVSAPDNTVTSFYGVTLSTNLSLGDTDVVFSRLQGIPSATGTITITSDRLNSTATITITGTGLVK